MRHLDPQHTNHAPDTTSAPGLVPARRRRRALAAAGVALGGIAVTVPGAVPADIAHADDCVVIVCIDGNGLDVDVDVTVGGGSSDSEDPPPPDPDPVVDVDADIGIGTPPSGAPDPAGVTAEVDLHVGGGSNGATQTPRPDLLDLDATVDVGVQDVVVTATLPVDADLVADDGSLAPRVSTAPRVDVLVGERTVPVASDDEVLLDADAALDAAVELGGEPRGDGLLSVEEDLRCLLDLVIVDTSELACTSALVAGSDTLPGSPRASVDICDVGVALLGARQATCDETGDDGDGGGNDDGTDDDGSGDGDGTDGSDDGDGNGNGNGNGNGPDGGGDDGDGSDDGTSDGNGDGSTDASGRSGASGDAAGDQPFGFTAPRAPGDGDSSSGLLPTTGLGLMIMVIVGGALITAGSLILTARRERIAQPW